MAFIFDIVGGVILFLLGRFCDRRIQRNGAIDKNFLFYLYKGFQFGAYILYAFLIIDLWIAEPQEIDRVDGISEEDYQRFQESMEFKRLVAGLLFSFFFSLPFIVINQIYLFQQNAREVSLVDEYLNTDNKEDLSFSNRLMNFSITESIDKIKNNYNVFQKILILGIILNFTYGFYYFYVNDSFGDHNRVLTSNEPPKDGHLINYTVLKQSDVILGKPKTLGIIFSPFRDSPRGREKQSYKDSGITYQEFLVLILIGFFILFCIRIF